MHHETMLAVFSGLLKHIPPVLPSPRRMSSRPRRNMCVNGCWPGVLPRFLEFETLRREQPGITTIPSDS